MGVGVEKSGSGSGSGSRLSKIIPADLTADTGCRYNIKYNIDIILK